VREIRQLNLTKRAGLPLAFGVAITLVVTSAFAVPVQTPVATSIPCAILTKFEGAIQVLDASRTEMLEAGPHSQLRCGFWVSVVSGYAEIQHRDGQTLHLSAGTFAQFPDNNDDGYFSGDQMILYKGQAFIHAPNGFREFRVATANARARLERAQAVIVYSEASETTQLIGLERLASLENRFQPGTRIGVKPGEATELDSSAKRVVPSTPRAVSVASMREKAFALRLGEGDRARAVEVTKERHDRPYPTELVGNSYKPLVFGERGADRAPATEPIQGRGETYQATVFGPEGTSSYDRHILGAEESEQIEEMIVQKLVSGTRKPGREVTPRAPASTGKSRKSAVVRIGKKVSVHDVSGDTGRGAERLGHERLQQEDAERARLIEELSQISPD